MTLQAGEFIGTAIACGLSATKGGAPTMGVRMKLPGGTIVWWANFTELSWKRSVQTLRLLGWKGNSPEDILRLEQWSSASGEPGPLDPTKQVLVQIENDKDLQGNPRLKAAWINRLELALAPMEERSKNQFARWLADHIKDDPEVRDDDTRDDSYGDGPDDR